MGSGASMEKDSLKPLLLSEELVNGSASLASNALLRTSFTNYLKGGAWLDRLSQLVPDVQSGFSENSHEDNDCMLCLKEYNVDQARLDAFNSSSSGKLEKGRSVTLSTFGSFSKPLPIIARRYGDLYSGDTKSFTHQELLVILFALLYPIYLSSREYERFVKYGVEHDSSPRDETSVRSAVPGGNRHASRMVQTNQSKRAQELTLSCAARYDESLLLDCLQEATWLERLCPIFNGHTLALCITDTAKPGLPILFVNKAFCCMFGYTQSELIGHDLSVLNGPSTEPPQLELMHSNIHSTAIVKFAITLQHKSKKPLLDLVAQKAVGTYSISAHFVMTKSTSLDVLNVSVVVCFIKTISILLTFPFCYFFVDGGRRVDTFVLFGQSPRGACPASFLAPCSNCCVGEKRYQCN